MSVCARPIAVANCPSTTFVCPPESALVGGEFCELLVRLDVRLGIHPVLRLRDRDVLNLRIQAVDLDAEVLLQRQLHRIIDGKTADDAGVGLGWGLREG